MKIGLVDVDSKMPNLALMKISAYHKGQHDQVELTTPIFAASFQRIYCSQVFSWSKTPVLPDGAGKVWYGGPGLGSVQLMSGINDMCPDYDLYHCDYSIGFTTRGCPRRCEWCVVPAMEGNIRPEHDVDVFLRHGKVLLLDNNALAHPFGVQQMEKLVRLGVKVDYNQGLDARLIDDGVARLLSSLRWIRFVRLACDSDSMIDVVRRAVRRLSSAGFRGEIMAYVLAQDYESTSHRVEELEFMGVDPFVQPYRDRSGAGTNKLVSEYARYVNQKRLFRSILFEDFLAARKNSYLLNSNINNLQPTGEKIS